MSPHYYRIARKLQVQCLLSDGESGGKLSPDWKFIFPNPKLHILEISSSAASLNLKSFFIGLVQPQTLCIESSQRQNCGYRSRATRVHPKSQSWLNQRNYLSLSESLHWLESTSVWVGLHLYSVSSVCLY